MPQVIAADNGHLDQPGMIIETGVDMVALNRGK